MNFNIYIYIHYYMEKDHIYHILITIALIPLILAYDYENHLTTPHKSFHFLI